AQHPERGTCAFKVLRSRLASDPTAVKRFLREAGYGSRVEHPGVVRTYDYGEADGLYYLALEWAEGKSLAEYVHRAGPLAPTLVVSIVQQLAAALAAAHQAGIIHRDLKPENITYEPASQRAKLLDFGIARDAELPPEERLTRTGPPRLYPGSWWTVGPIFTASLQSPTGCSPDSILTAVAHRGSCFSSCSRKSQCHSTKSFRACASPQPSRRR
ncbi:MAG: hypothetical protein DMD42_08760, partial [Gemmatimonadetes bacterium]